MTSFGVCFFSTLCRSWNWLLIFFSKVTPRVNLANNFFTLLVMTVPILDDLHDIVYTCLKSVACQYGWGYYRFPRLYIYQSTTNPTYKCVGGIGKSYEFFCKRRLQFAFIKGTYSDSLNLYHGGSCIELYIVI